MDQQDGPEMPAGCCPIRYDALHLHDPVLLPLAARPGAAGLYPSPVEWPARLGLRCMGQCHTRVGGFVSNGCPQREVRGVHRTAGVGYQQSPAPHDFDVSNVGVCMPAVLAAMRAHADHARDLVSVERRTAADHEARIGQLHTARPRHRSAAARCVDSEPPRQRLALGTASGCELRASQQCRRGRERRTWVRRKTTGEGKCGAPVVIANRGPVPIRELQPVERLSGAFKVMKERVAIGSRRRQERGVEGELEGVPMIADRALVVKSIWQQLTVEARAQQPGAVRAPPLGPRQRRQVSADAQEPERLAGKVRVRAMVPAIVSLDEARVLPEHPAKANVTIRRPDGAVRSEAPDPAPCDAPECHFQRTGPVDPDTRRVLRDPFVQQQGEQIGELGAPREQPGLGQAQQLRVTVQFPEELHVVAQGRGAEVRPTPVCPPGQSSAEWMDVPPDLLEVDGE